VLVQGPPTAYRQAANATCTRISPQQVIGRRIHNL
jgi:hypothetical protein